MCDLKVFNADTNSAFSLLERAATQRARKGSLARTTLTHQTQLCERERATKLLKRLIAGIFKSRIVDVRGAPLTMHLILLDYAKHRRYQTSHDEK